MHTFNKIFFLCLTLATASHLFSMESSNAGQALARCFRKCAALSQEKYEMARSRIRSWVTCGMINNVPRPWSEQSYKNYKTLSNGEMLVMSSFFFALPFAPIPMIDLLETKKTTAISYGLFASCACCLCCDLCGVPWPDVYRHECSWVSQYGSPVMNVMRRAAKQD